jgi:Putative Flp pilus-assembly TadE/G-like
VRLDRRGDSGAVAILVAVLATVLFAFAAIVVDLGFARDLTAQAQDAADAAALAGVGDLYDDPPGAPNFQKAVDAIKGIAYANSLSSTYTNVEADNAWSACQAQSPGPGWTQGPGSESGTPCILFNSDSVPTMVRVVLPAVHADSFFGGLVGYGGMNVTATAKAQAFDTNIRDCSLCIASSLLTSGTVTVGGDGSLMAGSGTVQGSGLITVSGGGDVAFTRRPNPRHGPYSPDPILIDNVQNPLLGQGDPGQLPRNRSNDFVCDGTSETSLQTGHTYRNVTVSGPCGVNDGTVVVTGTMTLTGPTASLTGNQATLFFGCSRRNRARTCTPGQAGGSLTIQVGALLQLSGADLDGLGLDFDPGNSAGTTVFGQLAVNQADVYMARGALTVNGIGRVLVTTPGLVSVGSVTVAGSGGRLDVSAIGLGTTRGRYRLALTK